MNNKLDEPTKFRTNAPETYDQAVELMKEYYKTEKAKGTQLPAKFSILSWHLHESGRMVIVDGSSGKKLEFQTDPEAKAQAEAEEAAKTAEQLAEEAEAKAEAAKGAAAQAQADAEAKAKAAKGAAKAANLKSNEQVKAEMKAKDRGKPK